MKLQRLTVETMEDIIIENNGWYKVMYNLRELSIYIKIEYNTDMSVRHSNKSDDIVRTTSNKEDVELQNKESVR